MAKMGSPCRGESNANVLFTDAFDACKKLRPAGAFLAFAETAEDID